MATLTVYSSTADGSIISQALNDYPAARDGTSALSSSPGDTGSDNRMGQIGSYDPESGDTLYYDYETFIKFDTSALGAGATISTATLSIFAANKATSGSTFTIQTSVFDWGASVDDSDWRTGAQLNALTSYGTITSASLSTVAYTAFTDAGTGIAGSINKTGTTAYVLFTTRQKGSGTAPSGDEYAGIYVGGAPGTTNDPKLVITYTGSASLEGQAAIAGAVDVSATGFRTAFGSGDIAANVDVSATGLRTAFGSGDIAANVDISATGGVPTPPIPVATATTLTGVGSHRLWQRSRSITLS